jgi:hypothetical protein
MGLYRVLMQKLKKKLGGKNPPLYLKAPIAFMSGSIGSFASHPTDLVMVRFQNDGLLPKNQRRNYTSFFNAAIRMCKEEGVTKMWNGVTSNIARSASLTMG